MMLVSLYRANPGAFAGNNMNRLKSGHILSVPDAATIESTTGREARDVVVAHAADFNAYRKKIATQVSTSAPDEAPAARKSASGKITAQIGPLEAPLGRRPYCQGKGAGRHDCTRQGTRAQRQQPRKAPPVSEWLSLR